MNSSPLKASLKMVASAILADVEPWLPARRNRRRHSANSREIRTLPGREHFLRAASCRPLWQAGRPPLLFRQTLKKFALAALLAGTFFTAQAALKVGDPLPDLAGFKLEGTLPDSLKGKVVILDFWASWCGPCAESFPVMDELQKKYQDQGLVILAVSVDEKVAKMATFLKKNPVTFTIVRDAEHKLVATAGPETMPTSFIIDRAGKVRFLHNGFHGAATRKEYVEQIESLLKATP